MSSLDWPWWGVALAVVCLLAVLPYAIRGFTCLCAGVFILGMLGVACLVTFGSAVAALFQSLHKAVKRSRP